MYTPVVTLARAIADGIPASRIKRIAKWNGLQRPKTPRRDQLVIKLNNLANQINQHNSRKNAA